MLTPCMRLVQSWLERVSGSRAHRITAHLPQASFKGKAALIGSFHSETLKKVPVPALKGKNAANIIAPVLAIISWEFSGIL